MATELKNGGRGRNYAAGKIYKLVNDLNGEFYVGSTTTNLAKRKAFHKKVQMPGVKAVFDEIGWEELKIVLVEEWPCDNCDQLRQRERYWYDELRPSMNRRRPWVSELEVKESAKQWRETNAGKIKECAKRWRVANSDKIKERTKKYYETNAGKIKECAKRWRETNKDRCKKYKKRYREANAGKLNQYHKQWYEDNREKMQQYYETNKEKIKLYQKRHRDTKVECDCGAVISRMCIAQHQRTLKHRQWEALYSFIHC